MCPKQKLITKSKAHVVTASRVLEVFIFHPLSHLHAFDCYNMSANANSKGHRTHSYYGHFIVTELCDY